MPKDVEAALAPDGPRHPGVHERQLDVLEDVVLRNEIEGLEDEADPPVADARQLGVVDVLDGDAVEAVAAAARAVEAPEEMEERRLARPRRSHDGDELPLLDREVHAAQRGDLGRTDRVGPAEPGGFDQHLRRPRAAGDSRARARLR